MNIEFEHKVRTNFAEALSRFNFKTVHDVMDYLDWYWLADKTPPSQMQMIETVSELFEYAIKSFKDSDSYAATGGFLVRIWESGRVEIQFIVEESYSWEKE